MKHSERSSSYLAPLHPGFHATATSFMLKQKRLPVFSFPLFYLPPSICHQFLVTVLYQIASVSSSIFMLHKFPLNGYIRICLTSLLSSDIFSQSFAITNNAANNILYYHLFYVLMYLQGEFLEVVFLGQKFHEFVILRVLQTALPPMYDSACYFIPSPRVHRFF